MPEKTETKKKVKKVFFSCRYCNKGLASPQGKSTHEKNCSLNPTNQEPKIESAEIAKKLSPATIEKMEAATSPLKAVENRIKQAAEHGEPISPGEQESMAEILKFVKKQTEDQQEIDSNLKTAEKIQSEAKIFQATEILDTAKSGSKLDIKDALAISIIQNSQQAQQDAQQNRQLNNLFIQEKIKKLNDPKETSGGKFQEKILTIFLNKMLEAEGENDISKFEKNYAAMKKMIDLVGEKSPASEGFIQLGEIAKAYAPLLQEAFSKKQQQRQPQQEMPPEAPQGNPDDKIKELVSGDHNYSQPPVPKQIEIEGSEISDEEYSKKYGSELEEYGYDNSSSPFTGMYDNINKGYVAPTTTSPMTENP